MARARITYDWEPEPEEMANRMFVVADALRDARAPLLFAARQTREEIAESFRTETSPDGEGWQQWAESYIDEAEENNIGILRRDPPELFEAAIDHNAFSVVGDTLYYDTSGWPETSGGESYGWFHQDGAPHRRTKSGSPNPLPQREFVGLSNEGENMILATFMGWFDRSIDLFVTAKGNLAPRHSGRSAKTGRFASREVPIGNFRAGSRG
jgi:hypothetical protein